ncbi:tetratricopeptide repeat protein [Leptolyngbya boryana CZ1]|uniref:Tetratricopeptide repeat protein n=1 Tax=Leptolyngbya boryana CZ1 TaxID=3060204 RepID=A0AA96WTR4_LEPBY|nr:CHAT domain-containing protein [Leptolyngbya boryana]WNZ44129.1 tetratricopeptide repeat protein [Leptolyngbya boryana CZ1]
MRKLKRSISLFCLALSLVVTAPLLPLPGVAQSVVQNQTSEIDRVIEEGYRLYQEGSAESLRKAIVVFEKARQLSRSINASDKQALASLFLGGIYDSLGETQKALEYYNKVVMLFRAVGDRSREAVTLNNIGLIYSTLGQQQEALRYFNQALPLFHAVGDRSGEATTLNNIGLVYSALGQKQEALKYYNQALPLLQAVENRSGEATTLNNIGSIHDALGQQQEALKYYNQALPISRAVGNLDGEAATLNNIGFLYSKLGQQQEALKYYNQALLISRAVGNRGGEAKTLSNIAFVFADQKYIELAIAICKQSVNVFESIRQNHQKLPRELRESYTKSISSTYQALANLLIKQGRLPEAQAVLELLKIKELNIYTRDNRTPSNGISFTPAEIKALDEIFRPYATAAEFARQLSECAEKNCPNLDQLKRQRDRINDEVTAILDRLRTTLKNQVIDISKLNTQQYTEAAEKIINAQPGTVLIYPVITETKTQFLLAFKAGAGDQAPITFRAIDGDNISSDTLFQTANDLRNALADPTSDLKTLQTTSQKLYTWLIKPLEPEISHPSIKHLVFVGDRATRHIPFAALYDGKEYLINKRYTLTTVLAASTTRDPSEPQPKAPNVLAVGATDFKGASPLPYVKPEILSIVQTPENKQGIFPGLSYLNEQFSFDRLRDSLKGHNILHIATHGNLDPVNIDKSYLLTSSGEQITKSEIQRLRDYGLKGVHMVILSACDTGTGGKNSDNLEIAGISHYFMEGGAKSVIASLWKVNDPATALFMQALYKHLKAGMTKAQAIRQVQQDFINGKLTTQDAPTRSIVVVAEKISDRPTSPNFAHPYYWSPFILIGNNL